MTAERATGPGQLPSGGTRIDRTHPVTWTFDGRALAVIRPTGPGDITVTVTADGCDPQQIRVEAR